MSCLEKRRKVIIIIMIVLIILGIAGGCIGYKYSQNHTKNINDNSENNSNDDNININESNDTNNSANKDEYNITSFSREEAENYIRNSTKTEDLICSIPEYSDEVILGLKGINYVYCYLKYNRSDNSDFSIKYDVLNNMIFKEFNVSVSSIKSLQNADNKYSYGSNSAFWGSIFLSNNYLQDIIEIKVAIHHPLENIIEFSYNNTINSLVKLDEITYYGDYIYTISEKGGNYDIYKYDETSRKYNLVSDYQCKEIKYVTSYYGEYGKYKDVETCLQDYSSSGFMIFEENYSLLDINSGNISNYDKYFSIDNTTDKFSEIRDFGHYIVVEKNGKYGIIRSDGEIISDFKFDQIGDSSNTDDVLNSISRKYYSINNDVIIFKDNNKYGLMKISTGEILVPANNEYIKFFHPYEKDHGEYYKIYNNGKWTIHDFKTNNVVYKDNNADDIYYVNSNLLIVREKGTLYFRDSNGNKISDSSIEITSYDNDKEIDLECDGIEYYSYDEEKLLIHVYHYGYCVGYEKPGILDSYIYNIKTGTLEKS